MEIILGIGFICLICLPGLAMIAGGLALLASAMERFTNKK